VAKQDLTLGFDVAKQDLTLRFAWAAKLNERDLIASAPFDC